MRNVRPRVFLTSVLSGAVLATLSACNRQPAQDTAPAPPAASATAAEAPAPYQRPTADQLYALVAPIALFPDKLVALTLAASTHADQVGDARDFVRGHADLTGGGLIDAADTQPWDPSVKALVAFPAVLDQMANNGEWTDALGQAYANEPTDVMNAIQVMRSRAAARGTLKSTAQQTVQVVDAPVPVTRTVVQDEIVEAPQRTIEIEPADPGVVYVPHYDPDVVYGEPVYSRVYETRYVEPAPGPSYHDAVVAGVVGFGAGILVGELFAHHEHADRPWGWNHWYTAWGDPRDRVPPAVVYDNHPYVVNRTVVNNRYVDRSVHIDNRHDIGNVHVQGAAPATPPRPAAFDYAHMQRPTFAPSMMQATAHDAHPLVPPPAVPGAAAGFSPRSMAAAVQPHGAPVGVPSPRAAPAPPVPVAARQAQDLHLPPHAQDRALAGNPGGQRDARQERGWPPGQRAPQAPVAFHREPQGMPAPSMPRSQPQPERQAPPRPTNPGRFQNAHAMQAPLQRELERPREEPPHREPPAPQRHDEHEPRRDPPPQHHDDHKHHDS
jgi:hypothetical protein